ncbi:hypothetical protein, partial [Methylicorpusculum sp.]|uniref:hypothetical protein n=1 Tax=Methylicorpusculum sp. TaxID=2713644 RepID=UPI002AB9DF8F
RNLPHWLSVNADTFSVSASKSMDTKNARVLCKNGIYFASSTNINNKCQIFGVVRGIRINPWRIQPINATPSKSPYKIMEC